MKTTLSATIALLSTALLLSLGCSGPKIKVAQDAKPLFTLVDTKGADLNDKQAIILDRIKKAPTTVSVSLARLEDEPLDSADVPLLLPLRPEVNLELKTYGLTKSKDLRGLTWKAKGGQDLATIVRRDKAITGLVYKDAKVYYLEPLGDGLQAIVQINQAKAAPDHPPTFKDVVHKSKNKQFIALAVPVADAPPPILRVLVAYTPKVESLVGDVNALIDGCIHLSNDSYVNSGINLRMELAHSLKVDYEESGSHQTDLANLQGKADGKMDNIHELRDQHRADVCVLLVNNSQYCGLAGDILADESSAFAVVHHACAVANLSFPHEVGHLLGARHNPEEDDTDSPFAHGHGYLNPGGTWRTIMAYPTAENPNRLPYWSNPDRKYPPGGNDPMGTASKHNNAKVLNSTASTICGFRP